MQSTVLCQESIVLLGLSTINLMRIMALLGDIVCDPLQTNREKIEISQVFRA